MSAEIIITGVYTTIPLKRGQTIVNTCGRGHNNLSPFELGPCKLYGGHIAERMENAWQYAKVYKQHLTTIAGRTDVSNYYWSWATNGWANFKAVRYPMGKGARPEFSLWDGERLGYVDARKRIYAPLYAEAVQASAGWKRLKKQYEESETLVLRDHDGYNHHVLNMSYTDVLNCPHKIMGHAFVLGMLLTNDPALEQIELRS